MKTVYQKLSRFLIGGIFAIVIFISSVIPAHAAIDPSLVVGCAQIFIQLLNSYEKDSSASNLSALNRMWSTSLNFTYSVEVSADDLWAAQADLASSGNTCSVVAVTYNGQTRYVLKGIGGAYLPQTSSSGLISIVGTEFVLQDKYFHNPEGYVFYSLHYPSSYTLSSINIRMTSFLSDISSYVDGIEGALSSINTKLDNIFSAITGSSSVMAEARSIIEQLSVYTSTSDTTNAAKQYWSRTFVDPSSVSNMVYVTYEDLSQLVVELANIGVTTRIYKDEAKGVYVIRDVGAWIVDPNTRSDYYSSSAAPEAEYHFYQHYFSLGRGQVICSTFPSLSLLLNDLNLRVVTVWNSIESANSRLLSISNHLGTISSHLVSVEDLLQSLVDYLESHGELDYQPPFYVRNISDSTQRYRIVPYVSMCQMLSDINVNYLGYPITDISVGEPVSLISSASMSASYTIAENDYYSLIIRYRNESGEDIVGCLCDENGNAFRAYQMDNYPFRILESVDAIRDWLENADLENNTTVNNVVNNYVDEVTVSIDNFSRILDLFNTASEFGNIRADWGGAADYFINLGKDPFIDGGDGS